MLTLGEKVFYRGGGCDIPVNNSLSFLKWFVECPCLSGIIIVMVSTSNSIVTSPAVLWHHQQYCDIMSSIMMSPAVLNSIFFSINCLHRNRPYISVLLFHYVPIIFYHWYLFNFFENGLNVKDKRCFLKKKEKKDFHKGLKQDIKCTGQNQSFQERQSTEWVCMC